MTDAQILTIVLAAVPSTMAVLVGILINNSRLGDLNNRISDLNNRITELRNHVDARFNNVDARFDDMRDMWRSELRRVEEVLDARLKHIEER
jgi:flagellar capping protein FliD